MNKQFKTDAQDFLNSVQVLREVQTPESENHMYDELMQVKFLMPVVIHGELKEGADGKQILDEKTTFTFPSLATTKGDQYFMAFTSGEEMQKYPNKDRMHALTFTFDDYAKIIIQSEEIKGFVVDPYGMNIVYPKELVLSLKEQKEIREKGHSERVLHAQEHVMIGEPAKEPKELKAALKAYAKKDKTIQALYLQLMIYEEQQSYVVAVDADATNLKDVFDQLADAGRKHLKGMYLDFVDVHSELGIHVEEKTEPFYKKMFYKKLDIPFLAVIEECFHLKDGRCVVGVKVLHGKLSDNGEVSCLNEQRERLFTSCAQGIEYGRERVKVAKVNDTGRYGSHYGILMKDHPEDFKKGYFLSGK